MNFQPHLEKKLRNKCGTIEADLGKIQHKNVKKPRLIVNKITHLYLNYWNLAVDCEFILVTTKKGQKHDDPPRNTIEVVTTRF